MSDPREFQRIIFHVDMDSFYASCELSPKARVQNERRSLSAQILTRVKGEAWSLRAITQAKKLGLRSGMPISRAWELCPTGALCAARFFTLRRGLFQSYECPPNFCGQNGAGQHRRSVSGSIQSRERDHRGNWRRRSDDAIKALAKSDQKMHFRKYRHNVQHRGRKLQNNCKDSQQT